MLFFVKARIDVKKMMEFGNKLQNGELTSHTLNVYCLKDDPSVGLAIWQAESLEDFEAKFEPHREFYQEVMVVEPVIEASESQKILMQVLKDTNSQALS